MKLYAFAVPWPCGNRIWSSGYSIVPKSDIDEPSYIHLQHVLQLKADLSVPTYEIRSQERSQVDTKDRECWISNDYKSTAISPRSIV